MLQAGDESRQYECLCTLQRESQWHHRKTDYLVYEVADIGNMHSHFELAVGELPGAQGIVHISTACNQHFHDSDHFKRSRALADAYSKYAVSDIYYHQRRLKWLS